MTPNRFQKPFFNFFSYFRFISLLCLFATGMLACAQSAPKPEAAPPIEKSAIEKPTISAMDAATFYKLLLAELNILDGDARVAYALMLDTARKTKQPELFERAISIALGERSGDSALAAARAWLLADAGSIDAARYLVQINLGMERTELPAGKADLSIAFEVAKNVLKTTPSNADGALLAVSLMAAKSPLAEDLVKQYLASTTFRAKPEVRMAYSRALITNSRFDEALAQAKKLSLESPTFAPGWLVLGTLQYQTGLEAIEKQGYTNGSGNGNGKAYLAAAKTSLKKYIELTARMPPAQREAGQQRAYVLLANIAKSNKQYQEAFDILSKVVSADKGGEDSSLSNLQYDLAMMAEKLSKLDLMERILRDLMASKPNDPQAYNALGYSFAERNMRLPEAKTLIQQAVKLAPEDPFIADSLGWVEYKLGNLVEAQRILEAAYKNKADAEIAAHLGEVLWKAGQKDRAQTIWKEGLGLNKNNETLLETLKRFGINQLP